MDRTASSTGAGSRHAPAAIRVQTGGPSLVAGALGSELRRLRGQLDYHGRMLERIEESPVRDGRWRADLWLVERDLERLQRDTVKMMVRLTTARLNRGAVWSLETGAGERASALIQTCDAIDRRLETARALGRPVSL